MNSNSVKNVKNSDKLQFVGKQGRNIQWAANTGIGQMVFRVKPTGNVYVLFADYPEKLTEEDRNIFDSEEKFWVDFFNGKG